MNINLELATVPADIRVNIARGMAAFDRVVRTHGIYPFAMYRQETGWIGFEWGEVGTLPPAFQKAAQVREWLADGNTPYDGGSGWSHILAKRTWEGRWIAQYQGQNAETIARFLIIMMAKAPIQIARTKAYMDYIGYKVILRRKMTRGVNYWVLSGYETVKDKYRVVLESTGDYGGKTPPIQCLIGQTISTCADAFGSRHQAVAANSVWSLAYALYPDKDF